MHSVPTGSGTHTGRRVINESYASTYIPINANISDAVDAVRNSNGVIVCRSTLTNPTTVACLLMPLHWCERSDSSQLCVWLAWGLNRLTQDVMSSTLHGNPFPHGR